METRDHDGIPYGCAEEPEGWGESGEYVADGLRTLRGDIVWRAPWRDAPGYLYFLVEIRSRPDPEMPNRMKRYAIHLPQAADPGEIPPGALPPTYPMVLHTDTGKWRWDPDPDVGWRPEGCPGEAAALLAPYQVRQLVRFLSLADKDDADLARMDGIAPRVLRLARARTLRDLEAGLMPPRNSPRSGSRCWNGSGMSSCPR